MKIRSTAMLVALGVLAIASLTYVAPALAENENNSNTMQTMPAPDNNAQNQGTDNTGSSSTTMNSNNDNNNNTNSSSTDQATPDTATGDDDY